MTCGKKNIVKVNFEYNTKKNGCYLNAARIGGLSNLSNSILLLFWGGYVVNGVLFMLKHSV